MPTATTSHHYLGAFPDFKWIMLHPTWPGINLGMFFLVRTDNISIMVEEDAASAGRTLVNCGDKLGHRISSLVILNQ
jgi:hypothetical protein